MRTGAPTLQHWVKIAVYASTVFARKMKFRTEERTMVAVFSATLPLV